MNTLSSQPSFFNGVFAATLIPMHADLSYNYQELANHCHDLIEGSIFELRIHTGAGYRIYYAKKGNKIVILLCAGSKRSQSRDIEKAKKYWQDLGE